VQVPQPWHWAGSIQAAGQEAGAAAAEVGEEQAGAQGRRHDDQGDEEGGEAEEGQHERSEEQGLADQVQAEPGPRGRCLDGGRRTGGGDGGYGSGSGQGYGSGNGSGVGDLDLSQVEVSGGVDDLIPDVKGVQKVSLQKQGQVNIQAPGPIRGSQAAMVRRTSSSVMGVINSQQGRIMYAYTKYLRTDANLRGKVSIDVTIEADGSVSNTGVAESTVENDDFVREIIAILRRLRFEPIPEGSITVNVPLVFSRVE